MLAFLTHLIGHSNASLGVAVHVGAGVGRELEVYGMLPFTKVVMIEPDPSLNSKLDRKAKRYGNVDIIKRWLAPKSGDTQINQFANPRFNSLLPAKNLNKYFANLAHCEQTNILAIGINDFLSDLRGMDAKQINILVLDVQGAEAMLLNSCTTDVLHMFEWICVRNSDGGLYEESLSAKELPNKMAQLNYELRISDNQKAPFYEQYYQLNHSTVLLSQTQQKLDASQKDLELVLLQKQQALNEKNLARVQTDEKINTLRCQLTLKEKEATDLIEAQNKYQNNIVLLEKELKINKKQEEKNLNNINRLEFDLNHQDGSFSLLKVDLNSAELRLKKLNQEIGDLQTLNKSFENEFILQKELNEKLNSKLLRQEADFANLSESEERLRGEYQSSLDKFEVIQEQLNFVNSNFQNVSQELEHVNKEKLKLTKELEAVSQHLKEQIHWHHENKKWAESLRTQLDEKSSKYDKLQVDFNSAAFLSNKVIMKAQKDLENLRLKYKTKIQSEKKLISLINDLKLKIQSAAIYYLELERSYPQIREHDMSHVFENKKDD